MLDGIVNGAVHRNGSAHPSSLNGHGVHGPRGAVVLVVGAGMVGHRFCEKLIEYDSDRRFRIVLAGEEPRPAYDRVHLTNYFTQRSADALLLGTPAWYAERASTCGSTRASSAS